MRRTAWYPISLTVARKAEVSEHVISLSRSLLSTTFAFFFETAERPSAPRPRFLPIREDDREGASLSSESEVSSREMVPIGTRRSLEKGIHPSSAVAAS